MHGQQCRVFGVLVFKPLVTPATVMMNPVVIQFANFPAMNFDGLFSLQFFEVDAHRLAPDPDAVGDFLVGEINVMQGCQVHQFQQKPGNPLFRRVVAGARDIFCHLLHAMLGQFVQLHQGRRILTNRGDKFFDAHSISQTGQTHDGAIKTHEATALARHGHAVMTHERDIVDEVICPMILQGKRGVDGKVNPLLPASFFIQNLIFGEGHQPKLGQQALEHRLAQSRKDVIAFGVHGPS